MVVSDSVHQANNPTSIKFQSVEQFLANDISLTKYPDGLINDVLRKVLAKYGIEDGVVFDSDNSIALDNGHIKLG